MVVRGHVYYLARAQAKFLMRSGSLSGGAAASEWRLGLEGIGFRSAPLVIGELHCRSKVVSDSEGHVHPRHEHRTKQTLLRVPTREGN